MIGYRLSRDDLGFSESRAYISIMSVMRDMEPGNHLPQMKQYGMTKHLSSAIVLKRLPHRVLASAKSRLTLTDDAA